MKKIILSIVVILALGLMGCVDSAFRNCPECEEPEEKALVVVEFINWGNNEVNEKEAIFQYNIVNYGFVEAKDIEITCKINDVNNNLIQLKTEIIGNVASINYIYNEMYDNFQENSEEYLGFCYISNCSNCEMLNHRLPYFSDLIKQ